jgi:hypothetical protein
MDDSGCRQRVPLSSPWRAEKRPGGYIVRDANGQALAYLYSRENEAEGRTRYRSASQARNRVAGHIALGNRRLCLEWQRTGLAPPDSVRAATDAYFEEQDTIGEEDYTENVAWAARFSSVKASSL